MPYPGREMQLEASQTTPYIARLPQELLDKILDELAQPFCDGLDGPSGRWGTLQEWEAMFPNNGSSRDLTSSSLVCRRFRARCQFHLFAELRIPITQPGVVCTDEEWIARERQRALTVRHIIEAEETVMRPTTLSISFNFDNFEEFNHTDYADHVQLFQSIHQSSIKWRTLCFSRSGGGSRHAYKSVTLNSMLLRPFIRTEDITQIKLLDIKPVPFTFLASCPRLHSLICVDSKIEGPSQPATLPPLKIVVHLGELSLYNTFDTSHLTWIRALISSADSKFAPLNICQLRTLTLRTATLSDSRTLDTARKAESDVHKSLARRCGTNLSNLYVDIGDVTSTEPVLFLPLHYFTNLAHLDVIAKLCEVPRDLRTVLSNLCKWLSHLPHSRELAVINLRLTVSLYYTSISNFLDAGWDVLESTLMDLFEHSEFIKPRVSIFYALIGVAPALIDEIPSRYLEPREEGDDRGTRDLEYWYQGIGMTQKIGRYLFQVALPERFLHFPGSERVYFSIHHGTPPW